LTFWCGITGSVMGWKGPNPYKLVMGVKTPEINREQTGNNPGTNLKIMGTKRKQSGNKAGTKREQTRSKQGTNREQHGNKEQTQELTRKRVGEQFSNSWNVDCRRKENLAAETHGMLQAFSKRGIKAGAAWHAAVARQRPHGRRPERADKIDCVLSPFVCFRYICLIEGGGSASPFIFSIFDIEKQNSLCLCQVRMNATQGLPFLLSLRSISKENEETKD
jgi:hypothetical protein